MFKIIAVANHLPIKSGFPTAAKAYDWGKKNLPENSIGPWGSMNYKVHQYFIQKY